MSLWEAFGEGLKNVRKMLLQPRRKVVPVNSNRKFSDVASSINMENKKYICRGVSGPAPL